MDPDTPDASLSQCIPWCETNVARYARFSFSTEESRQGRKKRELAELKSRRETNERDGVTDDMQPCEEVLQYLEERHPKQLRYLADERQKLAAQQAAAAATAQGNASGNRNSPQPRGAYIVGGASPQTRGPPGSMPSFSLATASSTPPQPAGKTRSVAAELPLSPVRDRLGTLVKQQVAAAPPAAPPVETYRSSDGQHIYLHFINVKMLRDDMETRGPEAVLPSIVEARIIDREVVTQTPHTRQSFKALAHIPLHSSFVICFVDLRGIVAPATMAKFQASIDSRMDRLRQAQAHDDATAFRVQQAAWERHKQTGGAGANGVVGLRGGGFSALAAVSAYMPDSPSKVSPELIASMPALPASELPPLELPSAVGGDETYSRWHAPTLQQLVTSVTAANTDRLKESGSSWGAGTDRLRQPPQPITASPTTSGRGGKRTTTDKNPRGNADSSESPQPHRSQVSGWGPSPVFLASPPPPPATNNATSAWGSSTRGGGGSEQSAAAAAVTTASHVGSKVNVWTSVAGNRSQPKAKQRGGANVLASDDSDEAPRK